MMTTMMMMTRMMTTMRMMMSKETKGLAEVGTIRRSSSEVGADLHLQLEIDTTVPPLRQQNVKM